MSEINESVPLLQQTDVSLDRSSLHRRCKVSREKTRKGAQPSDRTHPEHDPSTCYLQDGGATASGQRVTKKLVLACGLAFSFMLVEIVGGYFADSIAIMSDAAHMFSDVFSFVVSVHCMRLIERKTDASYSFGYHRAETIGALVSILTVCVITGGLVVEAIQRLMTPAVIDGRLMFIVASLGIAFNLLLLITLGHDHHVHLGGGSCGHDHGHGHKHSHETVHSGHDGGSLAALGRMPIHTHGHADSLPDELSTIRLGKSGTEVEALRETEVGKSALVAGFADGHNHSSQDHKCDHSHDQSALSHDHSHDHAHGSSCGHSHALSQLHEQPDIHTQTHSSTHAHDHGHSHHSGHSHEHENQNLRGAIVHVMGDFLQSVGVAAAGAIIWYTDADPKWLWVDPACTFLFAISVIWVTKTLVVDITRDLMEAVPANIDIGSLSEKMRGVIGVSGVHDLHVWRVGTGKVILTAHVDVSRESASYQVIHDLEDIIGHAGIAHSTVQLCHVSLEARRLSGEPPAPLRNGSASGSGLVVIA